MKKLFHLATALALIVFTLAGCGANDAAEAFTAQSYAVDAEDVRSIEVNVRDRAIQVASTTGSQIILDYSESSKERYDIEQDGDTLRVTLLEGTKQWTDYVGVKASKENRTMRIQVPESTLNSLSIQTTNEPVEVSTMRIEDRVRLSSNGGDVRVDGLEAGSSISLDVKDGNIEGTLAGALSDYRISTTIKKGQSDLPDTTDEGGIALDLSANNGDIKLRFAEG